MEREKYLVNDGLYKESVGDDLGSGSGQGGGAFLKSLCRGCGSRSALGHLKAGT